MNWIKQRFDGEFQPWQIELPIEDLDMRRSGSIQRNGWTINYTFGREGDRGYMDFFAIS